jgi:acyl-CoA synthetase (AMP-forming)/AMP-acid ligase II
MRGLMMDTPLLVSSLIRHAAAVYGDQEIVSRTVEGPIHRYGYADAHRRSQRLANALASLGMEAGDRIGTIAWNTYRHFEIYFAVSGMGAVCHTMNPRLHPSQILYMLNHAEDRYVFVDLTFVPLIEQVASQATALKGVIVMTDRASMPDSSHQNLICYEDLIEGNSDSFDWPEFDEWTASSLCYTSGTTGNPKGVLYSNRATVLHSLTVAMPSVLNLSDSECILPIVPMFHANAWGIPYATAMTGTKLVMPGARLDGEAVYELLNDERVTFTAGVPTVWIMLLTYMREHGKKLDYLDRIVIGGSAAPRSMIRAFEEEFGVEVRHGWGMTEMSPVGAINTLSPAMRELPEEERLDIQSKQGRPPFGVEMKITDDAGKSLPHDGVAYGELKVRGPFICSGYLGLEESEAHADGWFDTNDVASIDGQGYMQIVDRKKDIIKSGGEWISSIDLEDLAMGHPDVMQAAVIGIAHPKWDERPLLLVVPAPGRSPDRQEILTYLEDKVAKWWLPDDVVFVESFPIGGTGKVLKTELRDQLKDYKLPGV